MCIQLIAAARAASTDLVTPTRMRVRMGRESGQVMDPRYSFQLEKSRGQLSAASSSPKAHYEPHGEVRVFLSKA